MLRVCRHSLLFHPFYRHYCCYRLHHAVSTKPTDPRAGIVWVCSYNSVKDAQNENFADCISATLSAPGVLVLTAAYDYGTVEILANAAADHVVFTIGTSKACAACCMH